MFTNLGEIGGQFHFAAITQRSQQTRVTNKQIQTPSRHRSQSKNRNNCNFFFNWSHTLRGGNPANGTRKSSRPLTATENFAAPSCTANRVRMRLHLPADEGWRNLHRASSKRWLRRRPSVTSATAGSNCASKWRCVRGNRSRRDAIFRKARQGNDSPSQISVKLVQQIDSSGVRLLGGRGRTDYLRSFSVGDEELLGFNGHHLDRFRNILRHQLTQFDIHQRNRQLTAGKQIMRLSYF